MMSEWDVRASEVLHTLTVDQTTGERARGNYA